MRCKPDSLMNQMGHCLEGKMQIPSDWVETTKDGLRISKLDALWFSNMACAPEGGCLFCTRITVAFIVVQL